MNRHQILNEIFSRQEMDIINDHEKELRGVISRTLQKIDANLTLSPEVETFADEITNLIFPENMQNSSIRSAAKEKIFDLLSSSKYFKYCEVIAEYLAYQEISIASILNAYDSFHLSAFCNSEDRNIQNFLLDLYNTTLQFGGGNSIGKGELMFAACFSDVKLANRHRNNSKANLYLLSDEKDIPIEVKDDGGRLDGSGIKATRLKEDALGNILSEAFEKCSSKYTLKSFQRALATAFKEGKIEENYYNNVIDSIQEAYQPLPSNPFSRENIPNIWFGIVPTLYLKISKAIKQVFGEQIGVSVETFVSYVLEAVYDNMYQKYLTTVSEEKVISDICIELANICCGSKDVEDFIVLDTTVRAKLYMGLSKNGDAFPRGFLLFSKAVSNDIIVHCIDFAENRDKEAWKTKAKSGKLHITPSNDDRRTAHAVYVKEA